MDARKINHEKLPERYLQNVHGYFKLKPKENDEERLPTRIDLCNSWDKETVPFSVILAKNKKIGGKFVFFYAVKFNQDMPEPVKIKEAPKSIESREAISNENLVEGTSEIIQIQHDCFTCEMQEVDPQMSGGG